MARLPKIDWVAARADYVLDQKQTYNTIAEKWGVSVKTVTKVGARDNWKGGRLAVIERAHEKVEDKASSKLAEVNLRHTNTYKNMQALGLAQLNIALKNIQAAQEEATAYAKIVDIKDPRILGQQRLKFLFDGLKAAMDGERITLGLPTSVSVSKSETATKESDALFEQVDTNELSRTIAKAAAALGQGIIDGDSAENNGPSPAQSGN